MRCSPWLADLTWPEVERRVADGVVLAVPVGATEQHGPHLPLSTDTDVAIALCLRLAARRGDVLIAPAVPYGSSGEHAGFPGTVSIGQEAIGLLLLELGRSAFTTFRRVVFISAHGGNAEPLARTAEQLIAEGHDLAVFVPSWEGEPHAGAAETSMLLAIDPDRVIMELAEPGDIHPLPELIETLRANGVRGTSANGVLGDPTTANPTAGEVLLERLTDDLVALVEAGGR